MPQLRKTCLVLLPKAHSEAHLALFERLADVFQFDLVRPGVDGNRAQSILNASFLLADLSGNDPEVLYDLGVAHTFGKRVFLVTDRIDRLAYDLASNRTWVVDPVSENREIQQAMAQFLSVPHAMGPVRLFLGKYAFFGENLIARRFLAFAFDTMWILLLVGIALHLTIPGSQPTVLERTEFILQQVPAAMDGNPDEPVTAVLISAAYFLLAYFVLSTWLFRATLGQIVAGLRVVQADYRRATFGQCVGRAVLSVLVVMTYGAAFLSAIRGPGHRAVHDMLSGTIVVRSHAF